MMVDRTQEYRPFRKLSRREPSIRLLIATDGIGPRSLDDIRSACEDFWKEVKHEDAYETFWARSPSKRFLDSVRAGNDPPADQVHEHLVGFLRKYGVQIGGDPAADLVAPLGVVARGVVRRLSGVDIETISSHHLIHIKRSFEKLDAVRLVGPTIASKILSLLKPELFMMSDSGIREAYGVSEGSVGYCRFMLLMRDLARRLREQYNEIPKEPDGSLERYLRPADRSWTPPLAKLLDECNWACFRK